MYDLVFYQDGSKNYCFMCIVCLVQNFALFKKIKLPETALGGSKNDFSWCEDIRYYERSVKRGELSSFVNNGQN